MPWDDRSSADQVVIDWLCTHGIRWSTFRDLWSDEDRQAVYDWLDHQAHTCPDCGSDTRESMDIANSFAYKATALDCHGCKAVAAEAARRVKDKPNPNAGTRFRVTRREVNDGHVDVPSAVGPQT